MGKGTYPRPAAEAKREALRAALQAAGNAGARMAELVALVGLQRSCVVHHLAQIGAMVASTPNSKHSRVFGAGCESAARAWMEAHPTTGHRSHISPARRADIIRAACGGRTRLEIADYTGISLSTVKNVLPEAVRNGEVLRTKMRGGSMLWFRYWAINEEIAIARTLLEMTRAPKPVKRADPRRVRPKTHIVITPAKPKPVSTAHQRFLAAKPIITSDTKVTIDPRRWVDTRYHVEQPVPVFSAMLPGQYL